MSYIIEQTPTSEQIDRILNIGQEKIDEEKIKLESASTLF